MSRLCHLSKEEMRIFHAKAQQGYDALKRKKLKLDMSRGKPSNEQVALSNAILSLPSPKDCIVDGVDVRNYGFLSGLPSCRAMFADMLKVRPEEVFIGGNSSLSLMYDLIAKAYTHGLLHSEKPWGKLDKVRFLCPVPGYDRHFSICESFGMEMINVPMLADGPDIDLVEKLVKDPCVKGMWCVPRFSNPDGNTYAPETTRRIAAIKPAADDFIIMWDNAYCVHAFDGSDSDIPDILSLCRSAGRPDMAVEFASTSKITLPGAGVSCFATSESNMEYLTRLIAAQSISYDKVNQLRHVLFLKNKANIRRHMKKHAAILKPKFDLVIDALDREIAPLGIACYQRPKGGYFISLYAMPGTAKRVHQLMRDAGVTVTSAGATYPYGKDPQGSNLRIAPSYPSMDEIKTAADALCICLKLAAAEKLQENNNKS